jgi:alkylhydroperoxidase/carboxymuconolactone decarboxylase family protein YurZ
VQAVLDDYSTAPISEQEKALFAFITKTIHQSNQITQADVDAAKAAGWSDEALYDAITVCALFQFYNTWIDATGVHDMSTAGYEMSAQRLSTVGYTMLTPPGENSAKAPAH